MKRLFPFGQGLPQEDEDEAYRERPKGKLPFHSHILIHCYIYRFLFFIFWKIFRIYLGDKRGRDIIYVLHVMNW